MEQKYHYQAHTGAINVLASAAERNSDSARNIRTIAAACADGKTALDPRFTVAIKKAFESLCEEKPPIPGRVDLAWEEIQKLRRANYYHWHTGELCSVIPFNADQWEDLRRMYDTWAEKNRLLS
jgi:hypothetical protein